ncbi:hypothetical protein GCM10027399_08980 [Curvibacter fontanus]
MAELSFPVVPPLTFLGRDVALPRAELGDVVTLTEPLQRPAGVTYFSYVPEAGTVRVCCRNHTVGLIAVPARSYGVTIEKDAG